MAMRVCIFALGLLAISMVCTASPYRRGQALDGERSMAVLKRLTSLMGALRKRAECSADVDWCADYITDADIDWQCNLPDVAQACCKKCEGHGGEGACADTADYCKTMYMGDCYDESTQKTCCNTCTAAATGGAGCEYGDKADWCSSYTKEDCSFLGSEECCKLCG